MSFPEVYVESLFRLLVASLRLLVLSPALHHRLIKDAS